MFPVGGLIRREGATLRYRRWCEGRRLDVEVGGVSKKLLVCDASTGPSGRRRARERFNGRSLTKERDLT